MNNNETSQNRILLEYKTEKILIEYTKAKSPIPVNLVEEKLPAQVKCVKTKPSGPDKRVKTQQVMIKYLKFVKVKPPAQVKHEKFVQPVQVKYVEEKLSAPVKLEKESKKEHILDSIDIGFWLYAFGSILVGPLQLYIVFLLFIKSNAGFALVAGSSIAAFIMFLIPGLIVKLIMTHIIAHILKIDYEYFKECIWDNVPLGYKFPLFQFQCGVHMLIRLTFVLIVRLITGDYSFRPHNPYIFCNDIAETMGLWT